MANLGKMLSPLETVHLLYQTKYECYGKQINGAHNGTHYGA